MMMYPQRKEKSCLLRHPLLAILLAVPWGLVLVAAATESNAAGTLPDPCTLVTKAEAATVLGKAIQDVKSQSRGADELKRLWDSLAEEQKRAAKQTGLDPSSLIEDARCEYSTTSDASPIDLNSYSGGSLTVIVGRTRSREEAAKVFRQACSGEAQPTLTYKQLSGVGDSACTLESSALMVLKNDIVLSLILVVFNAGDVVTVDVQPLAVKAVSRLP